MSSTDTPSKLPPGSLPPPIQPKPTRREKWARNRVLVIAVLLVVAFVVGSVAAATVPIVQNSDGFKITIVLYRIPSSTTYLAEQTLSMPHGGTVTATYWTLGGASLTFEAVYAHGNFTSENSTGSFQRVTGNSDTSVLFYITSEAPATVFINGTISFLAPFALW